jgi:hypothetical protein
MLQRALRASAIALLVGAVALWVATGAHTGWTKTEITEMKRDEITGIDYPVTREGFVMGIELLALGVFLSGAEFALSFLIRDPRKRLSP